MDLRSGLKCNKKQIPTDFIFTWQNGKYILVDDIFTEIIYKRRNVYHVRKVNTSKIFYLITNGSGKWSHGETLKEAKEDLIFKIDNRKKDDYKNLKLTHSLSFKDAIVCYRVITGACSFGTKDFVQNRLKTKQNKFTISEIINVTKGEYGNKEFTNFFK